MNKKLEYAIFTNNSTGKKLVYYPVAKNANSSAKLFFAKHVGFEDKIYFIEDEIPRYQRNLYLKKKFNSKIKLI